MIKTKRLFLFGAGAEFEWDAPTTSELTELVLESGFKMCDNKTTVTRFIYQTLLHNAYATKDVNFETIISVIEELVVYYANYDSNRGIQSVYSCFFESKFKNEILNFSIEGGKKNMVMHLKFLKVLSIISVNDLCKMKHLSSFFLNIF